MASDELLSSGHRGCAGCGEAMAVRMVLQAAGPNTIVTNATGCLEVMTTAYPETAWKIPWIHTAFENAAAVASGVDVALKKLGKREGVNILAFGGDGGTYDIGFQAISGMLERGNNVTYVVFDNEAYMNTGIQRCSSTPFAASTTTSPAGTVSTGKTEKKKPIAAIVAAHDIPYTATATIAKYKDLKRKVKKAVDTEGPSFIQVFSPCPTGWRYPSELTVELSRMAIETGIFVLWELESPDMNDMKVNYRPKERKPVEEYLKMQGRFKHLFKPEKRTDILNKIQKDVDEKWKWLEGLNEMAR